MYVVKCVHFIDIVLSEHKNSTQTKHSTMIEKHYIKTTYTVHQLIVYLGGHCFLKYKFIFLKINISKS